MVTDPDEEANLRRYGQAWRARGAEVAWVTGDALRRAEPLLNPEIATALSIPHAASIRPRLMTRAYAEAARRLGALISEQTEVIGFQHRGSKVTEIQTKQGSAGGSGGCSPPAGARGVLASSPFSSLPPQAAQEDI